MSKALAAEVTAEANRLMGDDWLDGVDFEAIETAVKQTALRVAAQAVAHRLNADHSDQKGPRQPCACSRQARYAGRRPKTFTTALGALTLVRAWYHCQHCRQGFSPRDRALGLERTTLSPAALRMTGVSAARVSFAEASDLLRELACLDIDPKQVERCAKALGQSIAQDEREVLELEPPQAPTLYLGLDGTGVPMRHTETEGRKGKQPGGSAKTREAKLAVIWSAESRDKHGLPVRDPDSVSCNAAIESVASRDTDSDPSPFASRVLREVQRRGFDQVPQRVVLGDGAPWIWNWAGEYAPDAIQIVDIYHAKQHLFEVAHAIYGTQSDLASHWAKQRRDELDQGHVHRILSELRTHAPSCDPARKCLDYFTHNQARMDYPKFHALGLCVATGVVEAQCKAVVGTRLKRGGMHWTLHGANAIIALRCAILSNRFDDFWERCAAAS